MSPIYDYLKDTLPSDHARQVNALDVACALLEKSQPETIVDLGCGTGSTIDPFKRHAPRSHWIGVDIEHSPEVSQRTRTDAEFRTFDGVNLPFADGELEFIFSNQVLEHVRHPDRLLADVRRVLKRGGIFVGQTSHLEPYHSFSLWNFTAYGFKRMCDDAGLAVSKLRPGIDGLTLVQRTMLGRPQSFSKWFRQESPQNQRIENQAKKKGKSVEFINFRKLLVCGQFVFVCRAT